MMFQKACALLALSTTLSSAATFQSSRAPNSRRPNTHILVLKDVPGKDGTMDSYNAAINKAFRAAKQKPQNPATETKGEDSAMMNYMKAISKHEGETGGVVDDANRLPTGLTMKEQVDSAMGSYMDAFAETQRESLVKPQVNNAGTTPSFHTLEQQPSKQVMDAEWSYETNRNDRPKDGQEMMEYMQAMESLQQQGQVPVESERHNYRASHTNHAGPPREAFSKNQDPPRGEPPQEYVPNVEDLASQFEAQQQLNREAQQSKVGRPVDAMSIMEDDMQALQPKPLQQQPPPQQPQQQQEYFRSAQQDVSASQAMQGFQATPEPEIADPGRAQREHFFKTQTQKPVDEQAFQPDPEPQQTNAKATHAQNSFQPDPEPPQARNVASKQQTFQPDPEPIRKVEQKPAAQARPQAQPKVQQQQQQQPAEGQYRKKPQSGSIFNKDYKYKNSVPRIADMYEMGPPVEYTKAVAQAAAQAQPVEKKPAPKQQQPQKPQPVQQQQKPQPVEQQQQQHKQQQQRQQYHKKPQTGSIFSKDYKYQSSVPRIADMYAMGPPPDDDTQAFPVEATPSPQASVPVVPNVAETQAEKPRKKVQATKAKAPETKSDLEDMMAAQLNEDVQPSSEPERSVDPPQAEAAPPPPKKKAFIASYPNFSSFADGDADEYDAYGNLKRKPTPADSKPKPPPRVKYAAKEGPPPPDLVIPAVSQLPDWAQSSFPEMGSSAPTASLEAEARSRPVQPPTPSASYAPAPVDLVIPAVSQLPDWAQNPFPSMGSSAPTQSLESGARSAPAPQAPAPQDLMIPAVSQIPDWAQNPFPEMGSSAPTASLEAMGPSPSSFTASAPAPAPEVSNEPLIGCSIEAYSDLPDWVLESQTKGPKQEFVDESYVDFDPTKPRVDATPRAVQGTEINTETAANDWVMGTPTTEAVNMQQEVVASEQMAVSQEAEVTASAVETAQESAEISTNAVEEALEDAETQLSEEADAPKTWKAASKEKHRSPFAGKVQMQSKKEAAKKKRPIEKQKSRPRKNQIEDQEDAFAAYMDVMAPNKMSSAERRANKTPKYEDPMDAYNEIMAPKQYAASTIPSFGADSVASEQEVSGRKRTTSKHSQDNLTSSKKEETNKDKKAKRTTKENAKRKSVSTQVDDTASATSFAIPWAGEASIHMPKDDALFAYLLSMQPKGKNSVALVGDVSIGNTEEGRINELYVGQTIQKEESVSVAEQDGDQPTEEEIPAVPDPSLMAEVQDAMVSYEEAMLVAEKGADLKDLAEHALDAENGPLSGFVNAITSKKRRLFSGKDEAIRAHNQVRQLQREQARKDNWKAYQDRVADDGSAPFFMNLNEPTMLTMDLQQQNTGPGMPLETAPSLMLSRDSDVVESILQGKPNLSTNILDSTSGLLIVNGPRPKGEDSASVEGDVDEDCDATETILRRTEISEGYSAWDAFQKLEQEWNHLEASKSSRYDMKWLRKVQNGVPPPYQFVTEDATWSQPHCWDKLRAQKNSKLDYDVIVAGGSVGVFFARALQLKGMNVCVVDGSNLVPEDEEWTVSMEELIELKNLDIISQDDVEAAVEISLKGSPPRAQDEESDDFVDVFVSPSILIQRVAERFRSGGGTILEQSPMMGIAISEYTGAAVNLGEGREPITASLVLDCIGEQSPIARQRRYGRVPTGVCAVVGACASGFEAETDEEGGDMVMASKKPEGGREGVKQYFWESMPATAGKQERDIFNSLQDDTDPDSKTTYMFTYVDGDDERPPLKSLMDDYWRRLAASQSSAQTPTELDVKRVMFAYFPTYKDADEEPQWSRILDLGGLHDSLSVGGLSPMIPHLGRMSNAILEALDSECLHKDDLAEINAYVPSLSATYMFQKALSAHGDDVNEDAVNKLLSANSVTSDDLEAAPGSPFLQDAASFDSMLGTLAMASDKNAMSLPETVQKAGLPKVMDWMKHGKMMSVYDNFDKSVAPKLEEKVEKLEPRQKFRWRRRLEAWKIGRGKKNDGPKP